MKFYNNDITRKVNIIFGSLFSDIWVNRKINSNEIKPFQVPLHYAPSQKFLSRNEFEKDLQNDKKVAVQFPSITYELKSLSFNEDKQINKNAIIRSCEDISLSTEDIVTYDYSYKLYIYSRTEEDLWQITEQILPLFNKTLKISSDKLNKLNIVQDLLFEIGDIDLNNEYEGDYKESGRILYNVIDFKVPVTMFGLSEIKDDIIRNVLTTIYDNPTFTPPAVTTISITEP